MSQDDNAMRFNDAMIANELMDVIYEEEQKDDGICELPFGCD